MFSPEVCTELGHYVYFLIDPRDKKPFYVGKGINNRVFDHIRVANSLVSKEEDGEDEESLKIKLINEIQQVACLQVIHIIHRHKIPENAVHEVEAALIDALTNLTNIHGGYGSSERGPMKTEEIQAKYGLKETVRSGDDKLLLININRSIEDQAHADCYECVRYAWRLNINNAQNVDYILAVHRGVVVDVFEAEQWLSATRANFQGLTKDIPTRHGFVGHVANEPARSHYRNTRLPETVTHRRSPVRYWGL